MHTESSEQEARCTLAAETQEGMTGYLRLTVGNESKHRVNITRKFSRASSITGERLGWVRPGAPLRLDATCMQLCGSSCVTPREQHSLAPERLRICTSRSPRQEPHHLPAVMPKPQASLFAHYDLRFNVSTPFPLRSLCQRPPAELCPCKDMRSGMQIRAVRSRDNKTRRCIITSNNVMPCCTHAQHKYSTHARSSAPRVPVSPQALSHTLQPRLLTSLGFMVLLQEHQTLK
jgi:hypothetical protein